MSFRIKRVYESPTESDGLRVLVDRIWPRGVAKARAGIDQWLKDLAPSTNLRKWFAHDPKRWVEFKRRYFEELDAQPEEIRDLVTLGTKRTVTLLYGAKESQYNQAVALQEYLEAQI